MKKTLVIVGAFVALGLALPAASAGETSSRVNFTCSNLKDAPHELRPPLADVFTPMPAEFPETKVCVSPVIPYGAHQFRVAIARSEIWCGTGGDCSTWILGRVGTGAFVDVAPSMSLSSKKGVTLKKGANGSADNLEIVFSEGTFRWDSKRKKFAYVTTSAGFEVTLTK